jgi:hypothetical protein
MFGEHVKGGPDTTNIAQADFVQKSSWSKCSHPWGFDKDSMWKNKVMYSLQTTL